MRRFNSFILLLMLPFASCIVLTDSQIKNINAFAASAKTYSNYPSEVFRQMADARFNNQMLQASQMPNADLIKTALSNAQKTHRAALQLSDKFDLSLQLIQQYASLLDQLSSDAFVKNLGENTDRLNENLTGLVTTYNSKMPDKLPTNVGPAISKAVFLVGSRLTKSRQAKELQKFIPIGDALIQRTINNLVEVLDTDNPSLKNLLELDRNTFISNYTNIILSVSDKVSFASIKEYNETLNSYENIKILRRQSIGAAKNLAEAHAELIKNIQSKRNLKEILKETQELIISIRDLKKTLADTNTAEN